MRLASRPRASGGHPPSGPGATRRASSSPRERGSSGFQGGPQPGLLVVPARAGVIPAEGVNAVIVRGRPRASGGHPRHSPFLPSPRTSSPRERGSSGVPRDLGRAGRVVPARAGVIRAGVVPARAGVIRPRPRSPLRGLRRPRASGGHPPGMDMRVDVEMSSPRERGSSEHSTAARRRVTVVPARAGVIPWRSRTRARRCGRPRASGGHPEAVTTSRYVVESSPRERGSSASPRGRPLRPPVVPARAGVIRPLRPSCSTAECRPRASGGHPPPLIGGPR